jgi:hypothetical protein
VGAGCRCKGITKGGQRIPPGWRELAGSREIAAAYNALEDPLLDGSETGEVHAFFTRISHEQFPYQAAEFPEVTRPYALFGLGSESVGTEIVTDDFWREALGCTLDRFEGAGLFLSVAAQRNSGLFEMDLLERPDLAAIFDEVPAEVIKSVALRHFSCTRDEFREEANRFRSSDSRLRRYDYNPLVGKPLIEWGNRRSSFQSASWFFEGSPLWDCTSFALRRVQQVPRRMLLLAMSGNSFRRMWAVSCKI